MSPPLLTLHSQRETPKPGKPESLRNIPESLEDLTASFDMVEVDEEALKLPYISLEDGL